MAWHNEVKAKKDNYNSILGEKLNSRTFMHPHNNIQGHRRTFSIFKYFSHLSDCVG